jgi:hypothetical protein
LRANKYLLFKKENIMEPIEKTLLVFIILVIVGMLGFVHACDVVNHRKVTGVIENTEFVWEKKRSFWETGERYERCVKIKLRLPNKKEEELFLRGNKDETTFLQGGKYFIKYRREDNKIAGKALLDD